MCPIQNQEKLYREAHTDSLQASIKALNSYTISSKLLLNFVHEETFEKSPANFVGKKKILTNCGSVIQKRLRSLEHPYSKSPSGNDGLRKGSFETGSSSSCLKREGVQ